MREKLAPIAPWLASTRRTITSAASFLLSAHFLPAILCNYYCFFGPWAAAEDTRSFGLDLAFLFLLVGILAHGRETELKARIAKLEALAFENDSAQQQGHAN